MKMFKQLFFVLLSICIRNSACVIDVLFDAGKGIWELHTIINGVTCNVNSSVELFHCIHGNKEVKDKIDVIYEQLDEIEKFMAPKIIRDSFKLTYEDVTISMCMDKIEMNILAIDLHYQKLYQHLNESSSDSNDQFFEFLQKNILNTEGHVGMIRKIIFDAGHLLANHENLVFAITGLASTLNEKLCNGPQLISNILVQLFRMVIIAEIKFTFITAITNMYLYSANEGWKVMNVFSKLDFETKFEESLYLFSLNLELSDATYLRACDPNNGRWIRDIVFRDWKFTDKSFYELEGTIQTTIFRYHWGVCKYGSCNDIQFILPNRCEGTIYDVRTSCSHAVSECAYLSAIKACVLRTGPYKFQYVNSSALGSLGRNFQCPKNNGYIIEDGVGLNIVFSACACNCYSRENKISLLIMESKVSANKVITGVRFIRKAQILYIQPREGRLDGNGYISRYSQSWIRIPVTHNSSQIYSINRKNSVFFLDDVRLPPYFALTGVKFNEVTRGNVTGFAIEVFGLPFDYKSGRLDTKHESRVSNRVSSDVSGRSLSFEATSSLYTTLPHSPSPRKINFLKLKRSKLDDDFGQSTLPLFDGVPITCTPPTVLGGLGIFHKGVDGYAGFLSLRLYGIRYAEYFIDFTHHHIADHRLFSYSKED